MYQNSTSTHLPGGYNLNKSEKELGFGGFIPKNPERATFVEKVTHFKDDIDLTALRYPRIPELHTSRQSGIMSAIRERENFYEHQGMLFALPSRARLEGLI